ncbi:hypothetical protein J7438_03020 [Thalassotalea sp. G20_0]|uniref:hypothetical protein n=1 Tax=Thalassotalea sp. G20_0 TaxID=2821093 RepID=UPI001ADB3F39|nr:hypothetical protein [Thalassotalea sp. G20_0]MBO9493065.1 hypothetical protein [Thalassotalea sp. G20_0]
MLESLLDKAGIRTLNEKLSKKTVHKQLLLLGVDGGGTSCRAHIVLATKLLR